MHTIAFLTALVMSLLWYFVDRRREKKQPKQQHRDLFEAVLRNESLDAYKREVSEKQPDELSRRKPLGIVYYSTPGKTYKRFIQDGRILHSGKIWPYPPNTP